MEHFRGDTIIKKIVSDNYQFRKGDKMKVAILKKVKDESYLYDNVITIDQDTNEFILEIPAKDTANLPTGKLLLELELTNIDGLVTTKQHEIFIKADGIYDRV